MKQFFFAAITILLFVSDILPQPGPAFHPMTANGAKVLYLLNPYGIPLKWKNPQGTTSNEVYIDYDSSKVAQLDPSVKFNQQNPLVDQIQFDPGFVFSRFFWRVVEKNASGSSAGPVWSFFMKGDPWVEQTDFDDFEFGLSRWVISNNQYSKWLLDIKSNYQLPVQAYNKVLSVKNTQQGVHDISYTSFKIYNQLQTVESITLLFSSDLKLSGGDSVSIQYSTDEGTTWITSQKYTSSERDTNKSVRLFSNFYSPLSSFIIRLKADLQNVTSSWAIDRFTVTTYSGILSQPIFNIRDVTGNDDHIVSLTVYVSFVGFPTFSLYRKTGIPSDPGEFIFVNNYPKYSGTYVITDSTATDSVYTYRMGNISNEATVYLNGITPVELVSFNAVASGDVVQLSWRTATETNNRGFYIERSFNKSNWDVLTFINGAGTTVSANDYNYTDKPGQSDIFYYRLRQQDFDGTVSYSKVEEVSLTPSGFYVSQNYPNPFNPQTTLMFNLPVEGTVIISLYNPTGQLVSTILNELKQPGSYRVNIDGSTLSSGVYFVTVKTLAGTSTKKIMLMK